MGSLEKAHGGGARRMKAYQSEGVAEQACDAPDPVVLGERAEGPEGRSEGCSGWKRHDTRPQDRSGSAVGGVLINNR